MGEERILIFCISHGYLSGYRMECPQIGPNPRGSQPKYRTPPSPARISDEEGRGLMRGNRSDAAFSGEREAHNLSGIGFNSLGCNHFGFMPSCG